MRHKYMKKNESNKFELFKKILLSKNGIGLTDLLSITNNSKSTFYRYLQQINDDLSHVFTETPICIEQKNAYFFISLPDSLNIGYVIDSLCLSYISVSPEYLIFSAAATRNYTSLEALAQDINLSPSYAYKTLNNLNKQLTHFNVRIAFGGPLQRHNIYGQETDIRFFLFYIYWNILKGLVWPFKKAPDYFKQLPLPIKVVLAPSQVTRLHYFKNITYWRILYLHEKVALDPELISYLTILNKENPTLFTWDFSEVLTSEEVIVEQLYFSFLVRFFIADIDSKEIKLKTSQLFIDSQLPLTKSCVRLLDILQKKYELDMTKDEHLLFNYHLTIAVLYIKYTNLNYKTPLENREHLSLLDVTGENFANMDKELSALVQNFFQEDVFFRKPITSGVTTRVVNLLYYIIDTSRKPKPLTIFCQYSKNFYIVDEIKNSLLTLFSAKAIMFTTSIQKADVVISDCYEGDIPNKDFFYFSDPYDPEAWKLLSQFIHNHLHNTFFYK